MPADAPVFTLQNRAFKWGDGFFETMKVQNGKLILKQFHFERMQRTLTLLKLNLDAEISFSKLEDHILHLCVQNGCAAKARVRLSIFRQPSSASFAIEAEPLDKSVDEWPEKGWKMGQYPFAQKSVDAFSNLKTSSFLTYVLARLYADDNDLDEVLVFNTQHCICDGSVTNVFLIKEQVIYTPALHQGCIDGVMRRMVIDCCKKMGLEVVQKEISVEEVQQADEVFLTNAIKIIRWVASFQNSTYHHQQTKKIFSELIHQISMQ